MKKSLLSVLLTAAFAAVSTSAVASPITGGISFSGAATPTGGADWSTATGIDFGTAFVVSGNGSYATVPAFTTFASFSDFTFSPFSGPIAPLWTFSANSQTYSFDLLAITSLSQIGNSVSNRIDIEGTGTLSIGSDSTGGVWTFTGNGNNGAFSFSAGNAAVPVPGSLALLGLGLAGLGLSRRRAAARA